MLFDRIKAQPAMATEYDCLTGFGVTRHKQQQGALTDTLTRFDRSVQRVRYGARTAQPAATLCRALTS